MWIMRGANDDAGLCAERTREISHSWRWHRAQHVDVDTSGSEPRLQRSLKHIARNARVFADQDFAFASLCEHFAGRPAQLQHEVRRNGIGTYGATNAVCPEIFLHPALRMLRLNARR